MWSGNDDTQFHAHVSVGLHMYTHPHTYFNSSSTVLDKWQVDWRATPLVVTAQLHSSRRRGGVSPNNSGTQYVEDSNNSMLCLPFSPLNSLIYSTMGAALITTITGHALQQSRRRRNRRGPEHGITRSK
eukprot:scpid86866/ scgid22554/ 